MENTVYSLYCLTMPIRSRDAFWGNPYNRDSMNSVWRLPRSEAGNPCNRDSIKSKVLGGEGGGLEGGGEPFSRRVPLPLPKPHPLPSQDFRPMGRPRGRSPSRRKPSRNPLPIWGMGCRGRIHALEPGWSPFSRMEEGGGRGWGCPCRVESPFHMGDRITPAGVGKKLKPFQHGRWVSIPSPFRCCAKVSASPIWAGHAVPCLASALPVWGTA